MSRFGARTMANRLGPTFQEELRTAGVEGKVLAVRFEGDTAQYVFSADATAADRRKVDDVFKAHDPNRKPLPLAYKEEQQVSRLATKLMTLDNAEIDALVESVASGEDGIRTLLKEILRMLAPMTREFYAEKDSVEQPLNATRVNR